MSGKNIIN